MSGYGTTGEKSSTGQAKEEVRQKAEEVKEQAQQKSAEAVEMARESTRAMLDQQKGRAAQGLGSVASALRQTGDSLNEGEQGMIGQYVQQAADKIDALAVQLEDRSVDEILYEAERFARREPEIFLGGAVLLGLLAARFLKASGSRRSSMREWEYNQGGQFSGPSSRYGYGAQGTGYYSGQYGRGQVGSTAQPGSWQGNPYGQTDDQSSTMGSGRGMGNSTPGTRLGSDTTTGESGVA